jgi:hypothetical protein
MCSSDRFSLIEVMLTATSTPSGPGSRLECRSAENATSASGGTFETCLMTLRMSADRGRPEVARPPSSGVIDTTDSAFVSSDHREPPDADQHLQLELPSGGFFFGRM